jgi:hypothetical protein
MVDFRNWEIVVYLLWAFSAVDDTQCKQMGYAGAVSHSVGSVTCIVPLKGTEAYYHERRNN